MLTPLLLNAARAFALVSISDGKIAGSEEHRFARMALAEHGLKNPAKNDVAEAWSQAVREAHASQSFGGLLTSIRNEITAAEDKALIMKIAEAATVADAKLEEQEGLAIQKLAEALGLDPSAY